MRYTNTRRLLLLLLLLLPRPLSPSPRNYRNSHPHYRGKHRDNRGITAIPIPVSVFNPRPITINRNPNNAKSIKPNMNQKLKKLPIK